MQKYYLAVDIGASSGRHMLGWLEGGKLKLEEVYRFKNAMENKGGRLCWNIDSLFNHIKEGIKKCCVTGKAPSYMGIDTWAVDFVLLDKHDKVIGECVGYRDSRTEGLDEEISKMISPIGLYERTGIQKQIFNTIYQLAAVKKYNPDALAQAETFLMVPDYFNFLLTGKKANEYTNATTTQLVNAQTKNWDWELIKALGFPEKIFQKIMPAGSVLGTLNDDMAQKLGADLTVILPATHDTGSAVLAVPNEKETIYLSSGTWSLMGIERMNADCSEISREQNYTNEGGYGYRFRYLKNIMGLWMIQSLKKELNDEYSFDDLCKQAVENKGFSSRVDVNNSRFLSPDSMIQAVKDYCGSTQQQIPDTVGQLAAVIYYSLADCYAKTVDELESITGNTYECVNIVGGGSKDDFLCQITADTIGKTVYAGPVEATALGNIIAQMLSQGDLKSLNEARLIINQSFPIVQYQNN